MTAVRRLTILGSTGSVGTQALDIVRANPDLFTVVGLSAGGGNRALFQRQAAEFPTARTAVGAEASTRLAADVEADVVLNAITGSVGLGPTLATLEAGRILALANKESLVAGGAI
jgi:1-deoxy-D-xylulose-5-phosphate reductoisomerase